jgi:peptidoglycan/xylan/chitin deacetylase (PgdA/CDA1 family)
MAPTRRAALMTLLGAGLTAGCSTPVAAPPSGSPPSAGRGPAASPSALPAEVVHGPRTVPAVALTFHGQGSAAALDVLDRAGVRATVFAVGVWLAAEPSMARRVLDSGHELGNHTYSHVDIKGLTPAGALAEIQRCADVLRRLTGTVGPWFRPSQTARTTHELIAAARTAGYPTTISYDVDSLDFTDPGPSTITREVLKNVQPGSIVSLHLDHAGTVDALPAILDGLRGRGLAPVTVTELLR